MTRDELILAALAAGYASTAELARTSGLTERTCRYATRHLMAEGYAWSPQRGRWRLTEAGRVIALGLPGLPATDQSRVKVVVAPVPTTAETEEPSPSPAPPGLPASLGWAVAGLVAVVALVIARRWPSAPPGSPPSAPGPTIWPYDWPSRQ